MAASVKTRIGRLSRGSTSVGRANGMDAINPRSMRYPTATPRRPPVVASSRLSVNICPKISRGVAPSEPRIASSFWRAMPLAKRRFATLTHAISSTKPTAPISSQSVSLRSLGRKSFLYGSTYAPQPLLLLG